MSVEAVSILLLVSLLICLVSGLPLVFVLGGLSVVFTIFLWGPQALYMVGIRAYSNMTSFILLAVPMFIFMGSVLEKSGIADSLYTMMYKWIGWLKGGLAIGTVLICTLFAAMVGVSAAATVAMGVIALPSMLKRNYNKDIAIGCINAGSALGILIPPSVLMIVLGMFAGLSIGQLFIGGIIPGLILSFLFIAYIGIRAILQPTLAPSVPLEDRPTWKEKFVSLRGVILPMLLVITVLGAIFTGAATPTEASALGAFGSVICAAIHRRLTWHNFLESCYSTLRLSCMVVWILFAAACFTSLYTVAHAPQLVGDLLAGAPGGRWGVIITIQIIFFIMGCFLDPIGIMMICIPVFFPVIKSLGFDPLWFGIIFVVNMEMAMITPPFGFNLFYMKSIVPKGITMVDIYRSIIPFVILQAIGLALMMIFPQLTLWLPSLMIK